MEKKIIAHFIHWWKEYFYSKKSCYYSFESLLKKYDIEMESFYDIKNNINDTNQDILLYSVFGNMKQENINKYKNTYKIFYTGENKPLDKNADLNLTFTDTNQYNNIRFPVWILNLITNIPFKDDNAFFDKNYFKDLSKLTLTPKENTEFCCFIYSNKKQDRINIFNMLSKYKKIDSPGSCMNNHECIGNSIQDKVEFQKKYKFCIAFENSSNDGYTTEKILHAYLCNCIPIYWGNKNVHLDFNKETMICVHDFKSFEDAVEYIKKVDNDEELYNKYMNKPIFSNTWIERFSDPEEQFFRNVVNKIINKK